MSWAQNAYTLTFGGLLLLGARVGDLLGRRRTFIAGIAVFAAGSLAVGASQSAPWMIAARAMQGVGAALLAPSTLALLSTSFPEGPQRTRAMAAYGALAGLGTSVGLILGGALTQLLSWRVGFFLNVPIGIAAILAAPRLLEETAPHAGRLELTGALSSTLGVSALVYGIVHSAAAGWTDPVTLGALLAGLVLVGVFVSDQRRSPQPVMPLRLFADRQRAGAYAARFLFNGALLSFFFFMTQYLQGVRGATPLQAGALFLPVTAAASAAATATPRLVKRAGNPLLAILGCAAMLIGTAWISRLSASTGYLTGLLAPMIIFGIGQGLGLSTLTTAGMAGVGTRDAGVAGGLVNVSHHTGGALGLGLLITIFAAAGRGARQALLADRVSAALTGAAALLALALLVTLVTHPGRRRAAIVDPARGARLPTAQSHAHPGPEAFSESRAAALTPTTQEKPWRSPARASTPPKASPTASQGLDGEQQRGLVVGGWCDAGVVTAAVGDRSH
ncbi:MAG: MFS transporter [Solirubrobacterales bacterium]|nr:MFS transporter [Solirubrobacterales bacterium]